MEKEGIYDGCHHRCHLSDGEGMYGRPLVGKSFFGISAKESGAVMYAAFVRGR